MLCNIKNATPNAQGREHAAHDYLVPGEQSPIPRDIMDSIYFVTDAQWSYLQKYPFDFIVIGSGFTGLAFVDQIYKINPFARILMLERGEFWLPTHFQNLPLPFRYTMNSHSETFPWTLSPKTYETPHIRFMHGSCPFFGGRSVFWSAWSPSPTPDLLRGFPQKLLEVSQQPEFWSHAKTLLNVTGANTINDGIFSKLQRQLKSRLAQHVKHFVPTADAVIDAPLAVGNQSSVLRFNKFSTPGPLLTLHENQKKAVLMGKGNSFSIATRCIVLRLASDEDGQVTAIETSRGIFPVGKAEVILCMGCIPSTTLLMNSFPTQLKNAGTRLTGHFLSHTTARIKRSHFDKLAPTLEIAALYLAGKNNMNRQYHIQITGIASPHPEVEATDAARECPDFAASVTSEQLQNSEDYVVLACTAVGELTEDNPNNWVKRNKGFDPTMNVTLQVIPSDKDYALWNTMDDAVFRTIEAIAFQKDQEAIIEYWHNIDGGKWTPTRPTEEERRVPGLVHEASTLWMGTDAKTSVVGPDYRPHGLKNVYVTGSSIFPSAGSWNPTLTICGFAQDLARTLVDKR